MTDLAVVETHPIQYHAPVYRELQQTHGINVTAIYGSDFSVAGYTDREFGTSFAWDTDLLSGYAQRFLARVESGGARTAQKVIARGLRVALQEINPRAILLTGYSPRFYRVAFRVAATLNVPLLFRAETADHARKRNALKRWFRDNALRHVYTKCSALLYVGEHSRMHYERLGVPSDKLFFSPYCVDTTPFRAGESDRESMREIRREEVEIEDNVFVILFSGKLVPRKDPLRIIEAARLLTEGAKPVVVFLGSGQLRDDLAVAASIDPPVQVRFVGFQNQRAMSAFFHATDVLVLPSVRDETWGLVVNEALAHGVPCVVSDSVGCALDLIREGATGTVFENGNADDLAVALRRTLPLLNNTAVRTRCREIVEDYSVKVAARGIAAAFQQVTRPV
ncbi:MAG TPA: glycosyltransferase family 4 protein [Longimicrobiales bacterium]